MKPPLREWFISRWHSILDYDQKPTPKLLQARKVRAKSKMARLNEDAIKQRKRFAGNQAALAQIAERAEQERVNPTPPKGHICPQCGTMGKPVSRTKGSLLVELGLWLLMCVPGVIYSLWRLSSTERVCAQCGSLPIPIRTPRGVELWRRTYGGGIREISRLG